jgi:hypothetical protein
MKKLLLSIFLTTTLTSCALYDAYMMAGYDTNEYGLSVKIQTIGELGPKFCSNQSTSYLYFKDAYEKSVELKNFTMHIEDNKEAHKLATELTKLTKGAVEMYEKQTPVSEPFCKLKMAQIEKNANQISHVLARKPR